MFCSEDSDIRLEHQENSEYPDFSKASYTQRTAGEVRAHLSGVDLKNNHNLKFESYVLFSGNFRISSSGDSVSSNPERTALRQRGEEPGYIEVL